MFYCKDLLNNLFEELSIKAIKFCKYWKRMKIFTKIIKIINQIINDQKYLLLFK